MSLDLSGEITAIATAALALFAVVTAIFAFLAYRKQALEVGVLLDQNERDVAERRIAQAARVFTVVPRDSASTVSLSAKNASDLPIFDVQFWYSEPGGASGPDDLGRIMPGEMADIRGLDPVGIRRSDSPDDDLARTILAFRDAAGTRWIRMPDGDLKEQSGLTTREGVLIALGAKLPKAGLRPPAPGGKHELPTSFSLLDDLPVPPLRPGEARFGADPAIIVYPLSKGTLLFGGALDPERPLAILHKQLKVTSDDPDNRDVYIDQRAADDTDIPGRYVVSFDVWNYRDSPVTAQITRMDPADVAAESAMPLDPKGRWELFPDPGHDDTEPPLPPWPR